jgi:protocatechuate 4,5-dioxygenase, beta chain
LSWHLAESLIGEEFDMVTCQEMAVDHAFTLPLALLYPDMNWPLSVVPININTVLFPTPSAKRCFKFGQAIGRAVEAFDQDLRVLVIGTGGLSHQLEGTRAGFINKEFDLKFMDSLTSEPTWVTQYTDRELVKFAGTQGIELLNWLTARATMSGQVKELHRNYHIPISNTAAATLLLEPHA